MDYESCPKCKEEYYTSPPETCPKCGLKILEYSQTISNSINCQKTFEQAKRNIEIAKSENVRFERSIKNANRSIVGTSIVLMILLLLAKFDIEASIGSLIIGCIIIKLASNNKADSEKRTSENSISIERYESQVKTANFGFIKSESKLKSFDL